MDITYYVTLFSKHLGKEKKNNKIMLDLMTWRFIDNALTHCPAVISEFRQRKNDKKMHYFIVDFDWKYVTIWKCPIPP